MSVVLPQPRADDALTVAMVAELVGVRTTAVEFVWRNEFGGFTYRYTPSRRPYVSEQPLMYLSWVPAGHRSILDDARARAYWLGPYLPVPAFSDVRQGAGGWWMTSLALPGESAVGAWGKAHPHEAVTAIATGLRWLHDRAPVATCPFTRDAQAGFRQARRQAENIDQWGRGYGGYFADWDKDRVYDVLSHGFTREPDPVVCHGDPCAPNTLISPRTSAFVGIVDLSKVGVADRWADLAIATWSLTWNYGPGWEDVFFIAYGIVPDWEKIEFYRLLWAIG